MSTFATGVWRCDAWQQGKAKLVMCITAHGLNLGCEVLLRPLGDSSFPGPVSEEQLIHSNIQRDISCLCMGKTMTNRMTFEFKLRSEVPV